MPWLSTSLARSSGGEAKCLTPTPRPWNREAQGPS